MNRLCPSCNKDKELNEQNFELRKDTNKFRTTCKECENFKRMKRWFNNHQENLNYLNNKYKENTKYYNNLNKIYQEKIIILNFVV